MTSNQYHPPLEHPSQNLQGQRSWFSSWYNSKGGDSLMADSEHPDRPEPCDGTTGSMPGPKLPENNAGFCLQLCEGGRLGVLDVRLVGKTLQILVEDADITLQVIPSETSINPAAVEDASKPSPPKVGVTTGDRVLAENVLAKLLSGIPNLLLRDIRVKLILNQDSAIEISIGLLSVTDGSIDMLMHYGDVDEAEEDDASSSNASMPGPEFSPSGK